MASGAVVFCNVIVRINNDDFDMTGYIQNITYDTGTQSEHVQCLNSMGMPIAVNRINQSPSGTINFVSADDIQLFYTFLDGNESFDMTFDEYVTGQLGGASHTIIITGCMKDGNSGQSDAMSPNNRKAFKFKAINIQQ